MCEAHCCLAAHSQRKKECNSWASEDADNAQELHRVEGSRLARRPPRKRRAAAFTPRSKTTIGIGLNSSEREDIQTMDRQVFRAVVFGRNGTKKRVKSKGPFCRESLSPLNSALT
jgi:hypothetical protein